MVGEYDNLIVILVLKVEIGYFYSKFFGKINYIGMVLF